MIHTHVAGKNLLGIKSPLDEGVKEIKWVRLTDSLNKAGSALPSELNICRLDMEYSTILKNFRLEIACLNRF